MNMFFERFRRREPHHDPHREPHRRIPLVALVLMVIGLLTVLYFAVTYVLMPVLAGLTPRG